MLEHLLDGLTVLGHGSAVIFLFAGAVIGVLIGVIPGLSTAILLSILLAFVNKLSLTDTLCLFLGAYCGSFYSASISSILLNTPAHAEALPITFDGYPMARKGQPGRALGLSACSTVIGGLIGCGVLLAALQVLNDVPSIVHPPEYVALILLAMILIGTLGTDSVLKGVVAAGFGIVVASIGPSYITGVYRYTFNNVNLVGGISLVAAAIGVFVIPQMVMVYGTATAFPRQDMTGQQMEEVKEVVMVSGMARQLIGGVLETFRHWAVLIQSGLVGGITGIVPGIGGFTGNLMAYGIARQASRKHKRDLYGTGIPEGIIAPEGSSLAKEAGQMIPLLGLGIPGGIGGALLIAALTIKSITTGYGFTTTYPTVGYQMLWIIALSGLIGTVTGVLIGPLISRCVKLPGPLLVPFIFTFSVLGAFISEGTFFTVVEFVVFGVIGLVFRRLRYPLGALVMGIVLGPTLETNLYLTTKIYPGVSFVEKRPLADVIFLIVIAILASKAIELRNSGKKAREEFMVKIKQATNPSDRAMLARERQRREAPYPLLAVVNSALLLAAGLYVIFYGPTHYGKATWLMPVFGGILVAAPLIYLFPLDARRYVVHLKHSWRTVASDATYARYVPVDVASAGSGPATTQSREDPVRLGSEAPGPSAVTAAIPQAVSTAKVPSETAPEWSSRNGSPGQHSGPPPIKDRSWGPHGQFRREALCFLWLVALVVACWLAGFVWGTGLFVAAYGLTALARHLRTVRSRVLFTGIAAAGMVLVAYELLNLSATPFTPVLHL